MKKFLSGIIVGAVALHIYQQRQKNTKPSLIKETSHTIKNVQDSVRFLTQDALPQFNNTLQSVNKTVQQFLIQEQPRFIRIQSKLNTLATKDLS